MQSNEEMDGIVKACSEAGVQLMDGTMWMHNPRALHMRSVLDDPRAVGRLRSVTSSFAFPGEFKMKPAPFYATSFPLQFDIALPTVCKLTPVTTLVCSCSMPCWLKYQRVS